MKEPWPVGGVGKHRPRAIRQVAPFLGLCVHQVDGDVDHRDEEKHHRRHTQPHPPAGTAGRSAAELVEIGRVVAGDEQRQHGEPQWSEQDGGGVEILLVDGLDEEQGCDTGRDRQRDSVVVDRHQAPRENAAEVIPSATALEVGDEREHRAAESQVHEYEVEEKREHQEHVKEPERRRKTGRIDCGNEIRVHRPPPIEACSTSSPRASTARYSTRASSSSSVPTNGGM
ncbi:MAG: hypothetical protein AMJ54_17130 [Deltaproteobacteria bacterium SG8_13]|nr:MAG: hypothetical protein AMJ54_17130 [Deltaproteobacteria bacterium SG8_13]